MKVSTGKVGLGGKRIILPYRIGFKVYMFV